MFCSYCDHGSVKWRMECKTEVLEDSELQPYFGLNWSAAFSCWLTSISRTSRVSQKWSHDKCMQSELVFIDEIKVRNHIQTQVPHLVQTFRAALMHFERKNRICTLQDAGTAGSLPARSRPTFGQYATGDAVDDTIASG